MSKGCQKGVKRVSRGCQNSCDLSCFQFPPWSGSQLYWVIPLRLCSEGITAWQATRALHTGPKVYKELARGSTRVADTDRQKSFPNAVRDRYSDLDAVAMWVDFPADFAAACGFNVEVPGDYKHVKSFCNSAAGSGRNFEEDWLRSANRSVLPEAMVLYRQQLRTAAERDVERRPEIAQSFRDQGFDEAAVRNKTHYVCNAEIERQECDAALARREGLASTIAFESDGHPCVVADESKIPGVLEAMNRGLELRKQFVHKPYRSRADLVAHLQQQYPEIPPEAFAQVDSDWERKAQMTLEFRRRLIAGENPVLLSKHLVPDFLVGGRRVVGVIPCAFRS